jgi:isopropylmalate/isohomocitrate dehydrogenase-like protein
VANRTVVTIPGDGVGPEIIEATLHVLKSLDLGLDFVVREAGHKYWKRTGEPISGEVIDEIREGKVCLKGPTLTPAGPGTYRSVAATLRQALDLYANVRPIKSRKGVKCLYRDLDFVIVRENTEGLYVGLEHALGDIAIGLRRITKEGSRRIAKFAFEFARSEGRKKVTAVHKANIMKETCGLFIKTCKEVASEHPEVRFEEMHVDAAALKMVTNPRDFDVILTTNMFGDILSDEAAGLVGGLGLAPSANIGDEHAMFESAHGTAPDIAGKGIANPSAMILSAVLMLKHLGKGEDATRIEGALDKVLAEKKVLTPDLGGNAKTMGMAEEVTKNLG